MTDQISVLLSEERRFPPPADFAARASATPALYEAAARDRLAFWAEQARALDWITPWQSVLEWAPPHARWFGGGRLNVAANCLDRHLAGARRNKAAIIWEGEPGDRQVYTYWGLAREVGRAANALKRLGVRKGDRVAIYMPMVPEAAIAMLACTRIGAVHSVVFGGFSAESLRDRIIDAQATVLITADGGYRRGQVLPLKRMADERAHRLPEHPSRRGGPAARRRRGRRVVRGDDRGPGPLVAPAARPGEPRTAPPSRWSRRTCSSSSIPPARPGSRRGSCTPPAAT